MGKKFLAFDLETATINPDGDLSSLGISCYAVSSYITRLGEIRSQTGHGQDDYGKPSPKMSRQECRKLVKDLLLATEERGFTLLTHNGIGFDLRVLADESGMMEECSHLARKSVDMMLHFLCLQGFPVGLDAVARGMGLSGKTEGMSGGLVPEMWKERQFNKVLEYVRQDARTTLEVAMEVERRGKLNWITSKGKKRHIKIFEWLTMEEALKLPLPNTRWMDNPLSRNSLIEWTIELGEK